MIRAATRADTARLVEMAQHFLDSTIYGKLLQPAPGMILNMVDAVLADGIAFVAVRDGALVGMLGAMILEHPTTAATYLDEVAWWVEPAYRKGTVGPRLLAHMEGWASENGLHMVKMVAPEGTDVGAFYARAGYIALETAWMKVLP